LREFRINDQVIENSSQEDIKEEKNIPNPKENNPKRTSSINGHTTNGMTLQEDIANMTDVRTLAEKNEEKLNKLTQKVDSIDKKINSIESKLDMLLSRKSLIK